MVGKLEKVELYTIALLGIIGFVWMLVVAPYLISAVWFQALNPVLQYVLYNIGMLFIFITILGVPLSYFFKRDIRLKNMFISGLATFLLFSFVADMWQPPFYYSTMGKVLITAPESLSGVAVDRVTGYIWTSIIPAIQNTPILFALVYIVTPIIMAIIGALLLSPKTFVKAFTRGEQI